MQCKSDYDAKIVAVLTLRVTVSGSTSQGLIFKQEAQGLGALLDKMEDNDHTKLDNTEI